MDKRQSHLNLHDVILGGQDGLVNVLGVTLGVAAASADTRFILAAGLAATFAESFSMAAVAYTSSLTGSRAPLDALIVGVSAIFGSFIPIIPFVLLPIPLAMGVAVGVSGGCLFLLGLYKAKILNTGFWRGGLEITVIGMAAAFIGYLGARIFKASAG